MRRLALLAALLLISLAFAASAQARPLLGFSDTFGTAPDVALSKQTGATTDRMFVRWDYIEGVRGRYNWRATDTQYNNMIAAGVSPMWVVIGAPAWAHDPGCSKFVSCPQAPAYDADFDRFVAAFAQRYSQSAAIEIGNEVNLDNKWDTPDPARYTAILKGAYTAIKAVQPQMQVLVGGLCPGGVSGRTIAADAFLQAIYANGGKGYFDGIGWHIYVGGTLDSVAPDIKTEMNWGRRVRDANGDSVPFWVSETGFMSQGRSEWSPAVFSEHSQAESVAIDYRVLASMPDVHAVYFFRLLDSTQDGGFVASPGLLLGEKTMGLYRTDRSPKPAVQALRDAVAGPAWPDYHLTISAASPTIRSGQNFSLSVSGYGDSAPVHYEWLIWHTDHWSLPHAKTTGPHSPLHIWRPGAYRLAVRLVTSTDTYMSNPIDVAVLPQVKGTPAHKPHAKTRRHARKKSRTHGKRGAHARKHARAKRR